MPCLVFILAIAHRYTEQHLFVTHSIVFNARYRYRRVSSPGSYKNKEKLQEAAVKYQFENTDEVSPNNF
jgi:hypothetical protein